MYIYIHTYLCIHISQRISYNRYIYTQLSMMCILHIIVVHVYRHTEKCITTYIHTYLHTYIHACIYKYIHAHTCTCVYMCIYICKDVHIYPSNGLSMCPSSSCISAYPYYLSIYLCTYLSIYLYIYIPIH